MTISYKNAFVIITLCALIVHGDEEHDNGNEHIHTIHHHHVQKYEVIKKVEVPVIKEIKVPYYVYIPIKQPYTYFVRPLVVKVPIEYFHTNTEEHDRVKTIPPHDDDNEEHQHKDHFDDEQHLDDYEH